MQRDDWLVIDVETTGLGVEAEVVEAAIIGNRGDTLFTPWCARARRRSRRHPKCMGWTPRRSAISLDSSRSTTMLAEILTRRTVVAYNADFDQHVLAHTCRVAGLPQIDCTWECAMLRYEQWRGFRASLATVCEIESIAATGPHHRALPDARLVWNLIRRMAGESA